MTDGKPLWKPNPERAYQIKNFVGLSITRVEKYE